MVQKNMMDTLEKDPAKGAASRDSTDNRAVSEGGGPRIGKRERTKANNKEAILNAAQEVFGELGYGAATVRDIIRKTGLASGTFYNYFKSKEEVFEALMDRGALRLRPRIREQRLKSKTLQEFIYNAYHTYFLDLYDDIANYRMLQRNSGAVRVKMSTPEVLAGFDEIRKFIEEYIDAGKLADLDAEFLSAAAIGIASELGDRMLMRDEFDVDGATNFAVNLLFGGLPALSEAAQNKKS